MIHSCKIYFQQPTTAALMECATLSESGSHIVISKFQTLNTYYIVRLCNMYLKFKTYWWHVVKSGTGSGRICFTNLVGFPTSKSGTALIFSEKWQALQSLYNSQTYKKEKVQVRSHHFRQKAVPCRSPIAQSYVSTVSITDAHFAHNPKNIQSVHADQAQGAISMSTLSQ